MHEEFGNRDINKEEIKVFQFLLLLLLLSCADDRACVCLRVCVVYEIERESERQRNIISSRVKE